MADKIIREPQALYAVLQDKDALKRGPIFIEKDGRTEAVVLSIERYRELTGEAQSDRWSEQQLARLQPEIDAYRQMLPVLLKEHRGEWVRSMAVATSTSWGSPPDGMPGTPRARVATGR